MLAPPRCTVTLPKNSRPACVRIGAPSRCTTHGPNRGARGEADEDGEFGSAAKDDAAAVENDIEEEEEDDEEDDEDDEWVGVGGGESDSDRGMSECIDTLLPASELSGHFLLARPPAELLLDALAEVAASATETRSL